MTREQLVKFREAEEQARLVRWAADRDEKDAQIAVMQAEHDLGLRRDDEFFRHSMEHMAWLREVYAAFADGDQVRGNELLSIRKAA
jgi:hypothetical protein